MEPGTGHHHNKEKGKQGEDLATAYLQQLGFRIIERNYEYLDLGEIDIIARDGETLVFCEVKARYNDDYGAPEYAITARKQKQVRRIATGYLYAHRIKDQECRFDVVAIQFGETPPSIRYIKDAF